MGRELKRQDLSRLGVRVLNRGGFANPDVLLVPRDGQLPVVVKDYAPRSALVRRCVAPVLLHHELAVLRRVVGLPGLPAHAERLDRWALVMEYIDGLPLSGRAHRNALPAGFFDALEGILDVLAERGVFHLDLRSPSNILVTPSRAPALVDLGSAVVLRLPRRLMRRFDRRSLRKLRQRFLGEERVVAEESHPWERSNLELGSTRVFFRDRGRAEDPVPALFLHDIGFTSASFEDVLERAEHFGRRGIAIDLPGFGASRRRVRSLQPRRLAEQLEHLLDALRLKRVDLIGFGWGGWLAHALARRCPERIRTLRTARTEFQSLWSEAGEDPERLRLRLKSVIPAGLREDRRRELEYFLNLVPARNLTRVYASLAGERPAGDFWPSPPDDPDQIWRDLASASRS